ncbi:MAG: GH1 / GH5_19 [uncultured Blastococcus sp.]|uniref:Beta-glucosidase n=1 Tax=uncultured Blastococcus sp. TaxID=217144 RepID=A0A6J4HP02_9ACTN|nr:MAG: GH1 / GH5_19 [uncultured Blastococcus sp.]
MTTEATPPDFRWGVATSSFQIEGSATRDGRGPSIWDDFCRVPEAVAGGDTGEVACDSYLRWGDDLALLRRMGVNSYRFSTAWSRIQPTGSGPVNRPGLDHYDRMVDDLLEAGIEPFPTLYHWDLPSALQHEGGWVARDTAHRFADYAGIMAEALGDRVRRWTTLNEPLCSAWIGHLEGRMAPGLRDLRGAVHASYHLLLAHALGAEALRASAPATPSVGIVVNLSPIEPASGSEEDRLAAVRADGHVNRWWLDPLHGRGFPQDMVEVYGIDLPAEPGDEALAAPLDFLGINYYFRQRVVADPQIATLGFRQVPVPGARTTALDWEVHPPGLTDVLLRVAKEYGTPSLLVTENGSAWDDEADDDGYVADHERTQFLCDHVAAMRSAAEQGAPVHGYYAWSLMDNFEWAYGYRPRFGLARVDYGTQRRTLKLSGHTYARLIAEAAEAPAADRAGREV